MTFDERKEIFSKVKSSSYYILIGIISIISTVFLPMVGSSVGVEWVWPTTPLDWMIWAVTRFGIALINVMLLYCFVNQGKMNVKNHPNYLKANELLRKVQKNKELLPRSEKKFIGTMWTCKGLTLCVSSLVSTLVLTEAVLNFDLMSFLVYGFTVALGVIFGILQMFKVEDYYTTEYLKYAELVTKEEQETSKEEVQDVQL